MLFIIHIIFHHRLLQLALEVVAETKPSGGKARESYNALMRIVEGEKEVAWAEHQNSIILSCINAPHLVDDAENNISPAFLQSSGILTCHTVSHDTTQLDGMPAAAVDGDNRISFNDENSAVVEMLNSPYSKKVNADVTETASTRASHFHDNKEFVTPSWVKKTPVAMAIDRERGMTTPLGCSATVTKLPKSPHPRTLADTRVITPSNFNTSVKSPYVPSSLAREKHCVGMATSKHNNMAATPRCGCQSNVNDHRGVVDNHTPGSKQPFANLPPIFAPTMVKTKSESSDEDTPSDYQAQSTDAECNTGTPVITGFEDDFVPFNAHDNKNLSPNRVEHDVTYHIDRESSVSLNRTYTQALSELEEEHTVDSRDSKAAARKVGQEIWQKVNNIDYPPDQQHAKSHPLSAMQCDDEHIKKIPRYLSMTKSAAIKRLPSTKQPLLRSNKENIPGGRKITNTMKQSNRTVRPLARSASLKSRPVTYNW